MEIIRGSKEASHILLILVLLRHRTSQNMNTLNYLGPDTARTHVVMYCHIRRELTPCLGGRLRHASWPAACLDYRVGGFWCSQAAQSLPAPTPHENIRRVMQEGKLPPFQASVQVDCFGTQICSSKEQVES